MPVKGDSSWPWAGKSPIEKSRWQWGADGIARISAFMPLARCAQWCTALNDLIVSGALPRRVYETPSDPAILNDGGVFDHYILDGPGVAEAMPGMVSAYEATRLLVAEVTQPDAIISPYPRSAVNVNRYDAPTGRVSAHFDSNPISVILYLTDNPQDGATEFLRDGEIYRREFPIAGDLLIFRGRDLSHQSGCVLTGVKVAALWNYYTVQDQSRPAGMDDFMYGDVCR